MQDFILQIPEWQDELTFSREWIILIAVIFLVVTGVMFCFLGYKYFQTVVLMALSCGAYYLGCLISEMLTPNPVLQLFIATMLAFLEICLLYFAVTFVSFMINRSGVKNFLIKCMIPFSAVAGGMILLLDIYFGIWHNIIAAGMIAMGMSVTGLAVQYKKRKKQIQFRTYGDLLKLQPMTTKE